MSKQGRSQSSYLGEATTRLYNALDLDGQVSPDFQQGQSIIPVVVVADGLAPGMGQRRGRRWWAFISAGAGLGAWLRLDAGAQEGVQLDRFVSSTDTSGETTIRLAYGLVGGIQTTLGFVDRSTAIEPVPNLFAGSQAATGTAVGAIRNIANQSVTQALDVLLTPNMAIQFAPTGGAVTIGVWVMGRTF